MPKDSALPKLDHVCILVSDVRQAVQTFTRLLGLEEEDAVVLHDISDGDDRIDAAYLQLANCKLEFVAPSKADGVIASQLASRGEGLHHLDFSPSDGDHVEPAIERLRSDGWRLIDDELRVDEFGVKYTYVHPKDTHRALVGVSDPTNFDDYRTLANGEER